MKNILLFAGLLIAGTTNAQTTFQIAYGGTTTDWCESTQQTNDGGYIVVGGTYSFGIGGPFDVYITKTNSNGTIMWSKTYGDVNDQSALFVQQTTDGGYIVSGFTEKAITGNNVGLLMKLDSNGDTTWVKTYGGTSGDRFNCVRQTTDGGYIMVGSTSSFGAGQGDCYIIKTDNLGDTLWTRVIGGINSDYGESVQQTTDGGYIVTGTYDFADVYLFKLDANGILQWTNVYHWTNDYGNEVVQTTDGGYMVFGSTSFQGNSNVLLLKTDANGVMQWVYSYGTTPDMDDGYAGKQTTDGGYIVVGSTYSFGGGSEDVYVIKTDATGDTTWTKTYGGTDIDFANEVTQTPDGGYIISGHTESFGAGGTGDKYLIKTDANGNSGCNEYSTQTQRWDLSFGISTSTGGSVTTGGTIGSATFTIANAATSTDVECTSVGINESSINNNQITIYPNPTAGKFQIQSSNPDSYRDQVERVEVYDLFGRKVLESKEREIDMSSYPAGLYIWNIGNTRGKLIIE